MKAHQTFRRQFNPQTFAAAQTFDIVFTSRTGERVSWAKQTGTFLDSREFLALLKRLDSSRRAHAVTIPPHTQMKAYGRKGTLPRLPDSHPMIQQLRLDIESTL